MRSQLRPRRRFAWPRVLVSLAALALLIAACGDGTTTPDTNAEDAGAGAVADEEADELAIAFASFDVAVGDGQRLLTGILSTERDLLAHGQVTFRLGPLGDQAPNDADLTQEVTASYLPIPGMEPEGDYDSPRFLSGDPGNGVYAAEADLDEPGNWRLRVSAELEDGQVLEGETVFTVQEETGVPAIGDDAPRTINATAADAETGEVTPASIDSRAAGEDAEIPDLHLHDSVIADEIAAGNPVVVAVMTPVYCVSRFCGPLTGVISDLALEYEDTATFVHLEVWKDHGAGEVNEAASEWILPSSGASGNEPWVFLVDGDGQVINRWDNVLDVDELRAELDVL